MSDQYKNAPKKTLIAVVGPTAVGKTAMAIQIAQHFGTEILSADSRQIYQEMSIGTAVPSTEELASVQHHFIQSHSIAQAYSAGDYELEALSLLDKLFLTHDHVVVVGGSGLFVRAVTEGFDLLPKAPQEIRDRLNAQLQAEGLPAMQRRLAAIDPEHYDLMDYKNPQRVVRALEVYEATGKPLSSYQINSSKDRPFNVITVGLHTERTALYDRINLRVDHMMQAGLLEEVKALKAFRSTPALLTVGYAELFDYLEGNTTLEEAVEKIKQNTRRFAKRQITWFKKYGNTHWFEPQDLEGILAFISRVGL